MNKISEAGFCCRKFLFAGAALLSLMPVPPVQADSRHVLTDTSESIGGAIAMKANSKLEKATIHSESSEKSGVKTTLLSRDRTKVLQSRLLFLGYDLGAPHGVSGPETHRVVSEFRNDMGATVMGVLSPRDVKDLLGQTVDYSGKFETGKNDSGALIDLAEVPAQAGSEANLAGYFATSISAVAASSVNGQILANLDLPPELSFELAERYYDPVFVALDECATPKGIGHMWESGSDLIYPDTLLLVEVCINDEERYVDLDRRIAGLKISSKTADNIIYEATGRESDNTTLVLGCGNLCGNGDPVDRLSYLQIFINEPGKLHGPKQILNTQYVSGYLGTSFEPDFATLDGKYEVLGSVSPEIFFGPAAERRESGLVWISGVMMVKDGIASFTDEGSAYEGSGLKISSFSIDFHNLGNSALRGYSTNYLVEGYTPESWVNAKADIRQFGAVFSKNHIGIVGLGDTLVEYKDGKIVQGQGKLGLTARRVD